MAYFYLGGIFFYHYLEVDWILLLACRKPVLWALQSPELETQDFLFSAQYSKNLEDG